MKFERTASRRDPVVADNHAGALPGHLLETDSRHRRMPHQVFVEMP